MFTKGQRVRVSAKLSESKRYGVLVDGDVGTVVYVAGLIALVSWDRPQIRTNVNWGQIDLV